MTDEFDDDPAVTPAEGRITIVVTSPRVAPGLLSWPGWARLRQADTVLAADPDPAWRATLAEGGVTLEDTGAEDARHDAGVLVERAAAGGEVVWFGSPDGDPGLTDALADHLSRIAIAGRPPVVEVLTASHDVPGARLLDLVTVMERLRTGCPWDREQTHESLLPYLLEESHEVVEAVESGDRDHLREELGDLLLQVVFHARVAQEHAEQPFGIDDVAAGIVAKLVARHPHVFADAEADSADAVQVSWDELKKKEKPDRGTFDGIPATLPALARAQKMLGRLEKAGGDPIEGAVAATEGLDADEAAVADLLLRAVIAARAADLDAEFVLRAALRELRA